MIQPHYWWSYSNVTVTVGSFRGDAAESVEERAKSQSYVRASHSLVHMGFYGEAQLNVTNGGRANGSHPLPEVYIFMSWGNHRRVFMLPTHKSLAG